MFSQLDEVEYALPASEAPTLAEVLSAEEEDGKIVESVKTPDEPTACSALQVDFMQAVSQQITQAQVCYIANSHTNDLFFKFAS